MLLKLGDWEKYIRTVAARASLSIRWSDPDSVPSTDGKVMSIPTPTTKTTEARLDDILTSATHECGHVLYTDTDAPTREKVDMGSALGSLWNLFEDGRIESLQAAEYRGDAQRYAIQDHVIIGKYEDMATCPPLFKQDIFYVGWVLFAMLKCTENPSLQYGIDVALKNMPEDVSVLFRKVMGKGVFDVYKGAALIADKREGTSLTLKCARMVFDELSEERKEEVKRASPKGGEGAAKEGTGEGKEGGSEGESDKPSDKKGKGDGESKEGKVKWSDVLKSKAGFSGKPGSRVSIDYDAEGGEFAPRPLSEFNVHPISELDNHDVRKAAPMYAASRGFTNRVRTQLQIATRTRWQYGQKSGKLNKAAIHRVTVPNGGDYASRVFKNQTTQHDLDVALFVLLDMSGSMSNRGKIHHGMAACALLSDGVANGLQVPTEIVGFSESMVPDMYQIRTFGERNVNGDTVLRRIGAYTMTMRENTDGEALLYAASRLMQRREKRKLLIVLSDGQPAGGYGRGDIAAFTSKVAKELDKESPIEVCSIGIMDETVKEFYANWVVIKEASELESALLSVVKSRILGV